MCANGAARMNFARNNFPLRICIQLCCHLTGAMVHARQAHFLNFPKINSHFSLSFYVLDRASRFLLTEMAYIPK